MKTVKVFLASSHTLKKERDEVELFFRRKNDDSASIGTYFEVLRWELMSSSFHNSRKQDEYDSKVLGCDIFICLIDDRVGEFTKEEFETAYNGFRNGGRPDQLYVYFADYLVKPSELAADFRTVIALKDEIRAYQQIYREFENVHDLINQINENLRLDIRTQAQTTKTSAGKISLLEPEEEEGYLDLQEIYATQFAKAAEAMRRILQATAEHSAKQKEHTARISEINARGGGSGKAAVNRAAVDLETFALRIETETPIYSESMTKGMKAYGKSVKLIPDFHPNDSDYSRLERELVVLDGLQTATQFGMSANSTLRDSIAIFGPITTQHNRAKRHALSAMDSLIKVMERALTQIAEVQKTIQEILGSRK